MSLDDNKETIIEPVGQLNMDAIMKKMMNKRESMKVETPVLEYDKDELLSLLYRKFKGLPDREVKFLEAVFEFLQNRNEYFSKPGSTVAVTKIINKLTGNEDEVVNEIAFNRQRSRSRGYSNNSDSSDRPNRPSSTKAKNHKYFADATSLSTDKIHRASAKVNGVTRYKSSKHLPRTQSTTINYSISTIKNIRPSKTLKGKEPKYVIGKNPCIEIDIEVFEEEKSIGIQGTLNFILFKKERPKTVENFLTLLGIGNKTNKNKLLKSKNTTKKKKDYYSYLKVSNLFDHVNYNKGIIIGGNNIFEDNDGNINDESISIYGKHFKNENSMKHFINHQKYTLSMWNNEFSDKNGNTFFINMRQNLNYNHKCVVFGYIIDEESREFLEQCFALSYKQDIIKNTSNGWNTLTHIPDRQFKIKKISKAKPVRYPLVNPIQATKNKIT